MPWKIGIDGGGSKTEGILVDPSGAVAARQTGPGCSPSIAGAPRAREIAAAVLGSLRASHPSAEISRTLLCMAGSRAFWREFGEGMAGFGAVTTADDSVPVLELATGGGPGLVIHAGTGSFVAARSTDGALHYAGGVGWRFGDAGGGYDLGRRAIARALLELQGWAEPSGLGALVRERTGKAAAGEVSAHYYGDPQPNSAIASLAPDVLRLAGAGDAAATEAAAASVLHLLALAASVAYRLFPGAPPGSFRAGISGPILNHPFARQALLAKAPFPLAAVTEAPIEGVRLLLARASA